MTAVALLSGVAVRTAVVLLALFAGLRLIGRRHAGEARVDDILLVLLLANGVQNAMTTGSGRLTVALVCAATLLAGGWIVGVAFRRSPTFERVVGGAPTVLVHDGVLLRGNLRREQLTKAEVLVMVRKQGLERLTDVRLAVLEPNGTISVVKRKPTEGS